MRLLVALTVVIAATGPTVAESEDDRHRGAVTEWVAAHRAQIYAELEDFLAIPNVSADVENLWVNARHLDGMLEKRGIETRILEIAGKPYVYGRLAAEDPPPGRPAVVLFYCHFDGQPVDPASWTVTEPFKPVLTGELSDPGARLYARSASDDKGPIVALMAAIDALRALGIPPSVEAKFILDPEEEIGSPNIGDLLEGHADLLAADLMIFADGPVHQSGRPTVVFGTRGIVTVTLTVYGPTRPLHSGHYGNWAPNPAEKLARLVASMSDRSGRVLVEGFYEDVVPLSETELAALAAIPPVEEALMDDLLVGRPEGDGLTLQELINLPSLNVRGMASAWVGEGARTIIPTTATAEIDLRLVKGVEPRAQVERIRAHARAQGFRVVEDEPDGETLRNHGDVVRITSSHGVPAVRSSMDTPVSRAVIEAATRAVTVEPVLMPTLGGTLPVYPFEKVLGMPIYGVPICNPDNNQHAPDENLRLGNLWDGIVLYASLLRLGQ